MSKPAVVTRPTSRAAALHTPPQVLRRALASERRHLAPAVACGLACLVLLGALAIEASRSVWPGAAIPISLPIQQAVTRAVPGRLVNATMTGWGDLTVEIVLRDEGDAQENRMAALADVVAIAAGAYEVAQPRPFNVTVLGLASDESPAAHPLPVLYASLPADRMVGRDWSQTRGDDGATLAGVRWLPTGLCEAWHECG